MSRVLKFTRVRTTIKKEKEKRTVGVNRKAS